MSYSSMHNHTSLSSACLGFDDAISVPSELIQYAYDIGLNGVCITEHGSLTSTIQALQYRKGMNCDREFTVACGFEGYELTDEELVNESIEKFFHIVLIALDTEGYKQLCKLQTKSWARAWSYGFGWRTPILHSDFEEIIKPNQGHVVASTACLGGRIASHVLTDYNKAVKEARKLQSYFGNNNFFIEVQPSVDCESDQHSANLLLKKLSTELNIPLVCTTDTHYLREEDREIHKALLNAKDGEREVDEFYRMTYMMDGAELREKLSLEFSNKDIDEMYENTNNIFSRVGEYNIWHDPIIPRAPLNKIPYFAISHRYKNYYEKYKNFSYYSNREDVYERYFFYLAEKGLKSLVEDRGFDVEEHIARLDKEWKELIIISEELNNSMSDYYVTMSILIDLIWETGSLVGPARGSGAGFLTCYLLGITQFNPVPLGDYFPYWRHIHHKRGVELADIDIDSESGKKQEIIQAVKDFFGEDKVLQVATYSTITSKVAIEKACRGLNIPLEEANYMKNLIPVVRGEIMSIEKALNGDKESNTKGSAELRAKFDEHPGLEKVARGIEGIYANRGVHAAGLVISNEPYTEFLAMMRSPTGDACTCYDLHESEKVSETKYDFLTVSAMDKIHKAMNYMIEDGKIEWQGSLRKTYNKYIHPDVINYVNQDMWKDVGDCAIYDLFQMDTGVAKDIISKSKPKTVMDLSSANNLMRLMPEPGEETAAETYRRYKLNEQEFWNDCEKAGLTKEEASVIWEHCGSAFGLADTQEKVMLLSMDERTAGFTLKEANKIRKGIAKKSPKAREEARQMFFEWGEKRGTRKVFLNYIWYKVFGKSFGYSFSGLHSYSYSLIALQEMNICQFYGKEYWVSGVLQTECTGETGGIDYGKLSTAIYKYRSTGGSIDSPDINTAKIDFKPDVNNHAILYPILGISTIGKEVCEQILANRPYRNLKEFFTKNCYTGSAVTNSKIVMLIKAGCFDSMEPNRIKAMKKFIVFKHKYKDKLSMADAKKAINALPENIRYAITLKNEWCTEFVGMQGKTKKLYRVSFNSIAPYIDRLSENKDYYYEDDDIIISDKAIDKLFKPETTAIKEFINTPEFVKEYNKCLMRKAYNELVGDENLSRWSFDALSYFPDKHILEDIDLYKYGMIKFDDMPEEPVFIDKHYGKRSWKQYQLYQVAGVIINVNKNKHIITMLDANNNVFDVKLSREIFSQYDKQTTDENGNTVKGWLKRGNIIAVVGYRNGLDKFRQKKYNSSIYEHSITLIEIDKNNKPIFTSGR